MFDNESTLRSPRQIALEAAASEPLRLVLGDAHKRRGPGLLLASIVCFALVLVGVVAWLLAFGTQKGNPGFWQTSTVSVLYWVGISQALVAVSAILRITHAAWRYPLNRMLDIASLFGLWMVLLLPVLMMGRHEIYMLGMGTRTDKVWDMGDSYPIIWDSLAVLTGYFAGWALLYLTSLPDFAVLRDRAAAGTKQSKLYSRLAGNWRGTSRQWQVLRRAEGVLVVMIITSFVGSQTILGWDFELAAARNWDSSIFGGEYIMTCLLAALASAVLIMTVIGRRLLGFFTLKQYDNLGRMMVGLALVWTYFRICDFLTSWYGHIPEEWLIQDSRTFKVPVLALLSIVGCSAIPIFGNLTPFFRRKPWALCGISICVLIGTACQLDTNMMPVFAPKYGNAPLLPTFSSVVTFIGVGAMFVLTYLVAGRFVPLMSWWGTTKERTRRAERKMGNSTVTVMVEDPPLWEA